ncbi:MAG: protoporphyrinogen oxidase HemJ [Gammaproteobacteria bacterium]|nr:MAG: protoporphyrinogen oxidase HemJ [Gammaproteobacteria bacterium]
MTLLWLKAFHIIFMVTWFAGLFYLPRLFVYHTQVTDDAADAMFQTMEYKLFYYITTPGAVLTILLGLGLMHAYGAEWVKANGWLHVKLVFVGVLILFHVLCGRWLHAFRRGQNRHSERFFRIVNEIPVIPLIVIVILAVVKPF